MATTVATMVSNFKARIKDPNGRIFTSDGLLLNFLNAAQLFHQQKGGFRWPENEGSSASIALVSGTREYAQPTNFGMFEVFVRDGETINATDEMEFEEVIRLNPTNIEGTPSRFYLRGSNIGFEPIPNVTETGTLYFRKKLAALTAVDTTNIGFGDDHVEALLDLMEYFGWASLPDPSGKYKTLSENKLSSYLEGKLPMLRSAFINRNPIGLNFQSHRRQVEPHPRPLTLPRHR